MKKNIILLLLASSMTLASCSNIFNGVVLPNQCKKCELFDRSTGEKVWEVEGCGSENTRLEEKCQAKAWELSRGERLCDFDYKCKTWKKEKDQ